MHSSVAMITLLTTSTHGHVMAMIVSSRFARFRPEVEIASLQADFRGLIPRRGKPAGNSRPGLAEP